MVLGLRRLPQVQATHGQAQQPSARRANVLERWKTGNLARVQELRLRARLYGDDPDVDPVDQQRRRWQPRWLRRWIELRGRLGGRSGSRSELLAAVNGRVRHITNDRVLTDQPRASSVPETMRKVIVPLVLA